MVKIPDKTRTFLNKQHFVIVSSLNKDGSIHTSAKGILDLDPKGRIYILDLYKADTYRNVSKCPHVTLTAIDERKFEGYALIGTAKIVDENRISKKTLKQWDEKVTKRITRRVVRHVKEETLTHEGIPEARFPVPKYSIEVSVDRIIDLAPYKTHLKKQG